jgi:hypothetical protein
MINKFIGGGVMKKKFLKPFAATVGALLASGSAAAAPATLHDALGVDVSSTGDVAGGGVVLENSTSDSQETGHASHASHSSHASHASSSY